MSKKNKKNNKGINSFALGLKRANQKMLAKMGAVEISVDEEFDRYKADYLVEKKHIGEVQKVVDALVGHFGKCTTSLQVFAKEVSKGYQSHDPMKKNLATIEQIIANFDKQNYKPFMEKIKSNCSQKLVDFSKDFDNAKPSINKREDTKIKFDKLTSQVKKMITKPQKDPTKLPKKKDELKIASNAYNQAAVRSKETLAHLLDSIGGTYDPIVVEICESTAKLCREMAQSFELIAEVANSIKTAGYEREKRGVHEPIDDVKNASAPDVDDVYSSETPKSKPVQPIFTGDLAKLEKEYSSSEWYYLDENVQQTGPFELSQLKSFYKEGKIDGTTHIFGGELENWQVLSEVKGMIDIFKK